MEPSHVDEEHAIAQRAFAEGDLAHAATHIANAIGAHPGNAGYLDTLERILDSAEDQDTLFPTKPPLSVGQAACRAYALGRSGDVAAAIPILARVIIAEPDAGLLDWAESWLDEEVSTTGIGGMTCSP